MGLYNESTNGSTEQQEKAMTNKQQRYLSYLLRLWQTSDDGEQIWRASLESPGTGERQGFASIEDLIDFLRDRTGFQSGQGGNPDVAGRET
jgi:hypothetical protein